MSASSFFTAWFLFSTSFLLGMSVTKQQTITLPRNTRISLELRQLLHSQSAREGDIVRFSVVKDVIVDGKVLVRQGAPAEGKLREVRRRSFFGRSGRIAVDVTGVYAVDGQRVLLEEEVQVFEGDGRTGLSLGLICGIAIAAISLGQPWFVAAASLGALVKGKKVTLPIKSVFQGSVARSIDIAL